MNPLFFETQSELFDWYNENLNHEQLLWIQIYKTNSNTKSINYNEAVDLALCFGWVEGVRKSFDKNSWVIKFTPRKFNGIWSKKMIQRAEELIELGSMMPTGLKVFESRNIEKSNQYSYERENINLDERSEQELKSNQTAWEFFQSQSKSYKRSCTWWIIQAKREETRQKRINELIEDSSNGLKLLAFRKYNKK